MKRRCKTIIEIIITALGTCVIGAVVGYWVRKSTAEAKISSAEQEAKRVVDEAEKIGEAKKKEALLEAKEDIHKLRLELDKETKERRVELQRIERRLVQKEENLDRKIDSLEKKEDSLTQKEQDLEVSQSKIQELHEKQLAELERISGLSSEEARTMLLANAQEEIKHETAMMIKELEQQAKEESDKKAREIISLAIQRCAADHVAETTVSVVALPNDEMKGRIIGREGRNIRTLETMTGVDLIIDDTPEAVILSGFDPVRREVARIALNQGTDAALARLRPLAQLFPDRLYLELTRCGRDGEENWNAAALTLAAELSLPVLASNDVRFLNFVRLICKIGMETRIHLQYVEVGKVG